MAFLRGPLFFLSFQTHAKSKHEFKSIVRLYNLKSCTFVPFLSPPSPQNPIRRRQWGIGAVQNYGAPLRGYLASTSQSSSTFQLSLKCTALPTSAVWVDPIECHSSKIMKLHFPVSPTDRLGYMRASGAGARNDGFYFHPWSVKNLPHSHFSLQACCSGSRRGFPSLGMGSFRWMGRSLMTLGRPHYTLPPVQSAMTSTRSKFLLC